MNPWLLLRSRNLYRIHILTSCSIFLLLIARRSIPCLSWHWVFMFLSIYHFSPKAGFPKTLHVFHKLATCFCINLGLFAFSYINYFSGYDWDELWIVPHTSISTNACALLYYASICYLGCCPSVIYVPIPFSIPGSKITGYYSIVSILPQLSHYFNTISMCALPGWNLCLPFHYFLFLLLHHPAYIP